MSEIHSSFIRHCFIIDIIYIIIIFIVCID